MRSNTISLVILALVLSAFAGCDSATDPAEPCTEAIPTTRSPSPVEHVIHVSVDGLRPDAVTRQNADALPAFYRLRTEGAFTDNARTDVDFSVTLPNHADEFTGRPVRGAGGHGWTENRDPAPGATLHANRGAYVTSVFDVAHDYGLRTGAYTSKSKFVLFDRSYDAEHGAPDRTGPDDGRDKIDVYAYDSDTAALVERLVRDVQAAPYGYVFVHLRDPDSAGHSTGWDLQDGSAYMQAVQRVDGLLGELLDLAESDPRLAGRTALIVTADHGGRGTSHSADIPEDYTVPFYVWGPGVPAADLYALNPGVLGDPGEWQPGYDDRLQPVRNGAAANLALSLLGLGPVPCSTINEGGRMRVGLPTDVPAIRTAGRRDSPAVVPSPSIVTQR